MPTFYAGYFVQIHGVDELGLTAEELERKIREALLDALAVRTRDDIDVTLEETAGNTD